MRFGNKTESGESDRAPAQGQGSLYEGARCLFLGHSFFIPVAKTFDELATSNGFANHEATFVMSGGSSGAPGRIWKSQKHREAATKILQTGTVDLIGMTYYDESNCSFDDYRRWIDLAKKHNPKTHVFIGLCWPDSPSASVKDFDGTLSKAQDRLFKTVTELRGHYPDLKITFVNYGKVASLLKKGHAAGGVPEIEELIARSPQGLFRDQKGHAGPLLRELAALTWIQHLYNADLHDLSSDALRSESLTEILPKVAEFNQRFQ